MTPKSIVAHFNGVSKTAAALSMTRQIVNYWLRNGYVPFKRQEWIEFKTGGKLKASKLHARKP